MAEVHLVTLEVEQTVAAEIEDDGLLAAFLARLARLVDVAAIACDVSGATMMPSVRANSTAAL